MSRRRLGALALAGGLVAHSATAGLAIPGRRHPVVQAALGSALALLVRAPLGLRGEAARRGLALGAVTAGIVSAGVSATVAVPRVRSAMSVREVPAPGWKWLTVDIPLGTVWSEEAMYRGALATLASAAFGPARGRMLQAAAFGLSHVTDARAAGEPVVPTVLVTGAAGWLFGWLAERSGSLIAPVLVHLAINESGAIAALTVQRRAAR